MDLASNRAERFARGDCCLAERLELARTVLGHCTFCERRCGVNRLAGQVGPCGLGPDTYCLKRYLSLANDLDIVPALRVYLAGCNLRCRFCSGPEAFNPAAGERIRADAFAVHLESAIDRGVKTIQLIGGEPSIHPHTILAIAGAARRPLPLLLDTNLYMTPEVLELLDGAIRTYSANLKFGNDRCARDLAGVERYVEVVMRNLRMLAGRVDLRVRYLLLPGHVECCLTPLVERLSAELPGVRFDLLSGYMPCWQAEQVGLGRLNTRDELLAARRCLEGCTLDWRVDTDGPR
jgi:putative pyruvate formate lyase activating enzyme